MIAKQIIKKIDKAEIKDIIAILSTLILFSLFFISGPTYYSTPSFIQFWNIGHIIFFTLTNYLIIKQLEKQHVLLSFLSILFFTLVLGIIIEALQAKLDRSVDWRDIYRDLLGAGLAITLFMPLLKKSLKKTKNILLFAICGLILLDQLTLYHALKDEIQAQTNLPILADFEKRSELKQWSGHSLSQSTEQKVSGQHSMKAYLLSGSEYSGFTFEHFPRNWKNYQHLSFSLYNPDKTKIKLNIRITDYEHDIQLQRYNNRFNMQTRLVMGWNHIRIPLKKIIQSPLQRTMDATNMSQISFFTINLKNNKTLYIDNIILLK